MITKSTASIWSESLGQIYPALTMLEKQKKILAIKSNSGNGRNCKKYKITAKGTEALKEWLPLPSEQPIFRDEMMLKLFFGKSMSKEECLRHIQHRKTKIEQALSSYLIIQQHLENEHAEDEDSPFWQLTLSSGIHIARAALEWCDEAISKLQKIER